MEFDLKNIVAFFCIAFCVGSYLWCRHLTKLKDKAYSNVALIDVALQKRRNLAPDIVQRADKFMNDQRELTSDAVALLLEPVPAPLVNDITGLRRYLLHAEKLGEVLHFKFALAPKYDAYKAEPELEAMLDVFYENEREIERARKIYNKSVSDLKVATALFPANVFANMMRVRELPLFKDTEAHDMRGKQEQAELD